MAKNYLGTIPRSPGSNGAAGACAEWPCVTGWISAARRTARDRPIRPSSHVANEGQVKLDGIINADDDDPRRNVVQ